VRRLASNIKPDFATEELGDRSKEEFYKTPLARVFQELNIPFFPVVASEAYILYMEMINRMYNQRIAEKLGIDTSRTVEDARKDPRLAVVKMFQSSNVQIPIYVDFENFDPLPFRDIRLHERR